MAWERQRPRWLRCSGLANRNDVPIDLPHAIRLYGEQADGLNPYALGASGVPPASASRAGVTPQASRDRSSGTIQDKPTTGEQSLFH
jgi:hypothetical protein